ncbi:MAG: hypothetical protein NT068_02070 [Candidatus Nomurabacteria bacterium]|nr:hypothetical protein [Candidatus Nomurabacteria bacterium]
MDNVPHNKLFSEMDKEELNKAEEIIRKKLKPMSTEFYQLGLISELNMEFKEALEYYKQALACDPNNSVAILKVKNLEEKSK